MYFINYFICINSVDWVTVSGTTYRPGGIVVLSVEDFIPIFGKIVDVFVSEVNNYYLVCSVLTTECFCSHYHAYEITSSSPVSYTYVKQAHLADHLVLSLYKSKYNIMYREYLHLSFILHHSFVLYYEYT